MSTVSYAALTTKREQATPGTSTTGESPGVKTYVDAFAALVPAEVLTLHALVISVTTETKDHATNIKDAATLSGAFYGLLALAVILYVAPRVVGGKWDMLDYLRAAIPPLAFIGWTMLQRSTAFDAVFPDMADATRTVIALFLGVILGMAAAALAYKADQKAT